MEFIKDIFLFLIQRKKVWLLPSIIILMLVGLLIVATSGSAAGALIYTVF